MLDFATYQCIGGLKRGAIPKDLPQNVQYVILKNYFVLTNIKFLCCGNIQFEAEHFLEISGYHKIARKLSWSEPERVSRGLVQLKLRMNPEYRTSKHTLTMQNPIN